MPRSAIVTTLRAELRAAADPARAPGMQAYMKSQMPYLGAPAPVVRRVCSEAFAGVELPSAEAWQKLVLEIWRGAEHREERYAAITLTGDPRADAFQTPASLTMYEEMIVTGAWWDYVDEIAVRRLGRMLRDLPQPIRRTMRAWSRDRDMWKRRSSIICQVGSKADTDFGLLCACIEPSMGSREFFLRKAIGWALREHAKTDPDTVIRFARAHASELSPLSKREALRRLVVAGVTSPAP